MYGQTTNISFDMDSNSLIVVFNAPTYEGHHTKKYSAYLELEQFREDVQDWHSGVTFPTKSIELVGYDQEGYNDVVAQSEGWFVEPESEGVLAVHRCAGQTWLKGSFASNSFSTDDEALAFVKTRASRGDVCAASALRMINAPTYV